MRGRTDEPLATDAEVRVERARGMARILRSMQPFEEPPEGADDTLAAWIARCLVAHEVDTLKLAAPEGHQASGGRAVVAPRPHG